MRKFLRLSIPPFIAMLLAAAVAVVPPAGTAAARDHDLLQRRRIGAADQHHRRLDDRRAAVDGQFEPLKRFNYVYDAESCRRTVIPSCRGREGYTPDTSSARCAGCPAAGLGARDHGRLRRSELQLRHAVDAVMAEAGAAGHPDGDVADVARQDVSYVGPGSISNSGTFRANNRMLYQKAIQYGPRLQIADWATYSANHPEWFYADGIHFRPAGANASPYIADQAARVLAGQIVTPAGRSRPTIGTAEPDRRWATGVGSGSVRLTWAHRAPPVACRSPTT